MRHWTKFRKRNHEPSLVFCLYYFPGQLHWANLIMKRVILYISDIKNNTHVNRQGLKCGRRILLLYSVISVYFYVWFSIQRFKAQPTTIKPARVFGNWFWQIPFPGTLKNYMKNKTGKTTYLTNTQCSYKLIKRNSKVYRLKNIKAWFYLNKINGSRSSGNI